MYFTKVIKLTYLTYVICLVPGGGIHYSFDFGVLESFVRSLRSKGLE